MEVVVSWFVIIMSFQSWVLSSRAWVGHVARMHNKAACLAAGSACESLKEMERDEQ